MLTERELRIGSEEGLRPSARKNGRVHVEAVEEPHRDEPRREAIEEETPLERKLTAARAIEAPRNVGCRECWKRGRAAAIQAVMEGKDPVLAEPRGRDRHHRSSFDRGRDGAVAAMASAR